MSKINRTPRIPDKPLSKITTPTTTAQAPKLSEAKGGPANSPLFMIFSYLVLPTIISASMVAYYFTASSGSLSFVIIIGLWVVFRGFPAIIKRWFEKPVPTDKAYAHVFRLYFMLVITIVPYLLVFSFLYYRLGGKPADNCTNIVLTKTASLYFTTTTFTTTGFGDIHAVSKTCQLVVTTQMFTGFIIISIIVATLISRLLQLVVADRRRDSAP